MIVLLGMAAASADGETITLVNRNATAVFGPQATDETDELGLNSWTVDGYNHAYGRWFWYRVGSQTSESPINGSDVLEHVRSTSFDLEDGPEPDVMLVDYADTETATTPETFAVGIRSFLTGGSTGSNRSGIMETVRIENLDLDSALQITLFEYADFDVRGSGEDDAAIVTGSPKNTVRQTDPAGIVIETVATPPPTHYEIAEYEDIFDRLDDGSVTTLYDTGSPMIDDDVTWAFQWDLVIEPGDTFLLSQSINLRPGDPTVPEPSSWVLAAWGLLAAAFIRRRRR